MRLPFILALVVLMFGGLAYGQQQGVRYCATTTSGSISHEYCTFTPIVVAAPAVTVQPAQVTVTPRVEAVLPKPAAAPPPEKKIKE